MKKRTLLAFAAVAILASPLLIDCKPLEIHCVTAENCLQGQACVSGLCQDVTDGGDTDGGEGGSGGASGAGGAGTSSTGASSTGTGASGVDGGDDDGGTCPTQCSAPKPYCVGGACVQCTKSTEKTDCSGLTPCCVNNACSLGVC